jgi:hypothetical protein
MKIKNSEITPLLVTLVTYNKETGAMVGGLLSEKMSLGLRRRLQKIREALLAKHSELVKDMEEVNKQLPEGEERNGEMHKLLDEEVEVTFEPASLAMIEAIDTAANYDMALIEKIAQ